MKIGLCGFPKSRKKIYEEFDVVEIQKSFYTPISEETGKRYRKEAPQNFEFSVKALQVITHPHNSPTYRRYKGDIPINENVGFFKNTKEVFDGWEITRKFAKALDAKVIVFQCPSKFKENDENIKNMYGFFESIEREFIFGWEPRGKWSEETIKKICEDLNLIHVVDPFKNNKLHGDFAYYRLHGIGGYKYKYSDDDLRKLAEIVEKNDYVLFNNVYMYDDAKRFKEIVKNRKL